MTLRYSLFTNATLFPKSCPKMEHQTGTSCQCPYWQLFPNEKMTDVKNHLEDKNLSLSWKILSSERSSVWDAGQREARGAFLWDMCCELLTLGEKKCPFPKLTPTAKVRPPTKHGWFSMPLVTGVAVVNSSDWVPWTMELTPTVLRAGGPYCGLASTRLVESGGCEGPSFFLNSGSSAAWSPLAFFGYMIPIFPWRSLSFATCPTFHFLKNIKHLIDTYPDGFIFTSPSVKTAFLSRATFTGTRDQDFKIFGRCKKTHNTDTLIVILVSFGMLATEKPTPAIFWMFTSYTSCFSQSRNKKQTLPV